MELFQLRYFLAVAKWGSIARAGREIHVSQPSLSTQIQALEHELKCRLFERTTRGVRLTVAGERVREAAERMMGEVRDLVTDLSETDLSPYRAVRMGIQPLLASCYLPRILHSFLQEQTEIQVTVIERSNVLLPELVQRGEVHFAFMTRSDVIPRALEARPVFTSRYRVFGLKDKVMRRRRVWRMSELTGQPLVVFRDPADLEQRITQAAIRRGERPSIVFSSDQALTVLEMCAMGLGLGVLPSVAEEKARRLGLVSAPLSGLDVLCRGVVCRKKRSAMPEPAARLAQRLVDNGAVER